VWASEGHGAHVDLGPCAAAPDRLCGKLVWSWDPEIAKKQGDRLLLGDFRLDGATFVDGWLADPEDGRTYRGEIKITDDGVLRLKGCALVFCRSQTWRRIEDIPGCTAVSADRSASALQKEVD
jgi:uncharacterized protein (DUF2147 family)